MKKKIFIFFINLFFIIFFFIISDFTYSNFYYTNKNADKDSTEKKYRIQNLNYHHTLKSSFNGFGSWGGKKYKICTDPNGFKSSCNDINTNRKFFDIAFIGDSFTEGIGLSYEQTFVGKFANANKNLSIANLGVSSYSPTIYYSKINWLLKNGYHFNHVFIFVDISDIQDESQYFRDDEGNVIWVHDKLYNKEKNFIKSFILKNFTIFSKIYFYVKSHIAAELNIFFEIKKFFFKPHNLNFDELVLKNNRAAWTLNSNLQGYGELGVSGSIEKTLMEMEKLFAKLDSKNIKVSVGIYPWPTQLVEMELLQDKPILQEEIFDNFCNTRCANFINLFPTFRELIKISSAEEIYNKYYIKNDDHFNEKGNKLIYNHLKVIKN